MTTYRATVRLNGLRLDDVDTVIDLLRQYGFPHQVDLAAMTVTVDYQVGELNGIADLWDLRELVEETEAQLDGYLHHPKIGKPEVVA